MPTYEIPLLLRIMSRPELVTALKRVAGVIFERGGIIRKIENLGARDLPYKISSHGSHHRRANRFVFEVVVPPTSLNFIQDEFIRDVDIVRNRVYKVEKQAPIECTLHDELLPPAYRKDVQEMIDIANMRHKPKFKPNTGLDYYPFQK